MYSCDDLIKFCCVTATGPNCCFIEWSAFSAFSNIWDEGWLMPEEKKGLEGGVLQTRHREEQSRTPNLPGLLPPAPSCGSVPLKGSSLESTSALAASWSGPNLRPLTPSQQHHRTQSRMEKSLMVSAGGTHPVRHCGEHNTEERVQVLRAGTSVTHVLHTVFTAAPSYYTHNKFAQDHKKPFTLSVCVCACLSVCLSLRVTLPSVLMLPG